MPAKPLSTTIQPAAAPQIRGTTTAARAARIASEEEPSAATLASQPSNDMIGAALGLKPKAAPAAGEGDEGEEQAEGDDDEPGDGAQGEGDETAGDETEGADTGTEGDAGEQAAEGEEGAEGTLPPEAIQIRDAMQQRIDKLTAQKTEAAERAAELETQLEEARLNVTRPKPTIESPLAHVLTEAELENEIADAQATKQWALRNRNGAEIPAAKEGEEAKVYDADQVATILANAERQLDAVPDRRQFLAAQTQAREIGAKVAPEFFTKGKPEQQQLAACVAALPAAVRAWRPDIELVILQALVGSKVLAERSKPKTAKTAAPVKAPPAPGGRTAPRAPVKQLQQRSSAESNARIVKGGPRALADALEKRLFS